MFLVVMSQGELVDVVDYAQRDIEAAFHQHPASKFFPPGFLKMSQSHEQSERLVSLEHLSWSHKFFGYDICEDSVQISKAIQDSAESIIRFPWQRWVPINLLPNLSLIWERDE